MPPLRELEAYLFDTMARVGWRELLEILRSGADSKATAEAPAAIPSFSSQVNPRPGCGLEKGLRVYDPDILPAAQAS